MTPEPPETGSGFYKADGHALMYAGNRVIAAGYELDASNAADREQASHPSGWRWFANASEARRYLLQPTPTAGYYRPGENGLEYQPDGPPGGWLWFANDQDAHTHFEQEQD